MRNDLHDNLDHLERRTDALEQDIKDLLVLERVSFAAAVIFLLAMMVAIVAIVVTKGGAS
jgi:hypothetical protein